MGSFAIADGRLDLPRKKVAQIWLYHLVLFLVMISYYAFALAICLRLAGVPPFLLWLLFLEAGPDTTVLEEFFYGALLLLVIVLLWRMVPLLWLQLRGLITAHHDENDIDALYGLALSPEQYSQLYARVESVANRINAPCPDEIRITPEPQCHAVELRRFTILPDRRLVLVLGMPHLCVLYGRELDVILAHELSHVRAGDTRMSVFIFRFLESLETGVESTHGSRWRWFNVLYLLSLIYRTAMRRLTAPLVRRQETLADVASAIAFGGELAAGTLLKEWQLTHQFHAAVASYGSSGEAEGWTGLFRDFRKSWQEFSEEGRNYLLRRLEEEERPSFWDSHPATGQRIALMREFPNIEIEGDLQEHAHQLFPDFPALEEEMSLTFAKELFLGQHRDEFSPDDNEGDNHGSSDETCDSQLDATVSDGVPAQMQIDQTSDVRTSPSLDT